MYVCMYFLDVSVLIDALVSLPISFVTHPKCFHISRAVFLSYLLMSSLWFFWPWWFSSLHLLPTFWLLSFPSSELPPTLAHQLFSPESLAPPTVDGAIPLTWIAHIPSVFPICYVLLIISVLLTLLYLQLLLSFLFPVYFFFSVFQIVVWPRYNTVKCPNLKWMFVYVYTSVNHIPIKILKISTVSL